MTATLARPGLRGLVIEAYGAGNGPGARWFLDALTEASERGVVVVVTTQCGAGTVGGDAYATGAALLETGAVPAHDMTFEASITKLMVLLDRYSTRGAGADARRPRRRADPGLIGGGGSCVAELPTGPSVTQEGWCGELRFLRG